MVITESLGKALDRIIHETNEHLPQKDRAGLIAYRYRFHASPRGVDWGAGALVNVRGMTEYHTLKMQMGERFREALQRYFELFPRLVDGITLTMTVTENEIRFVLTVLRGWHRYRVQETLSMSQLKSFVQRGEMLGSLLEHFVVNIVTTYAGLDIESGNVPISEE